MNLVSNRGVSVIEQDTDLVTMDKYGDILLRRCFRADEACLNDAQWRGIKMQKFLNWVSNVISDYEMDGIFEGDTSNHIHINDPIITESNEEDNKVDIIFLAKIERSKEEYAKPSYH